MADKVTKMVVYGENAIEKVRTINGPTNVEKARKDVASITDANKKKAAEEKYNKELMAKKEKMDQDYAAKLKALDTSISQQINEKAKADGYDLVLSKGIVLFGGNDITSEIIKVVK